MLASLKCFCTTEIRCSFSSSSCSIFLFSRPLLSSRFSKLERLVRDSISSSESISLSSSTSAILCFIDNISASLGDIGVLVSSLILLSMLFMTLSSSNFSIWDVLRARIILSTFLSATENFLIDLSFSSSSLFEICANFSSLDKSLSSPSSTFNCVPTLSSSLLEVSTCEDSIRSKPLIWYFASSINFDICEVSSLSFPSRDFKPSVTILSVAVVSFSMGILLSGLLLFLLPKATSNSLRRICFSSSDIKHEPLLIFRGDINPYFLNCRSSSLSSFIRSSSTCFCT